MKTIRLLALAGLCAPLCAPLSATAQWEGVAEMKMTMKEGSGKGKVYASKVGTRSELEMTSAQAQHAGMGTMKMTMIVKVSDPDRVISLNDARKTYAIIDTKKLREQAPQAARSQESYTVKKLGSDSVAGFSCQNYRATEQKHGTETDLCITRDIMGSSSWLSARRGGEQGLMKALRDAGADGFPVRMVTREKGNKEPTVTMELVSAKRQSVASSMFEVPAGYTQEDMMSNMMSPEAAQKMKEAMEKMTPEQRKAMEEMMKKQRGGQ